MAKLFGSAIDLQKIPVLGLVPETGGTAPATPVPGQLWIDSSGSPAVIKAYENGSFQRLLGQSGGGGPPTGAAGGDLAGSTYPNPVIAANAVITSKILDANVTLAKLAGNSVDTSKVVDASLLLGDFAASCTDQAAGTASLRTLGTGAAQALAGTTKLNNIAPPTADVPWGNFKITGLADGVNPTDAATKQQLDAAIAGIDPKQSCKAASTGPLTLSGTQTVDGIALVANDRCLVKDQASAPTNGVYSVQAGAWTRASDMDLWSEVPSSYVWIEQGTVNADTGWYCGADQGGTLGSTNITWTQFNGAAQITAGNGLTKTGNTIDAVGTTNRISVAADTIDISAAYVGQGTITTLGTITTGTWNGTAIAVANGGTGAITAPTARNNLGAACSPSAGFVIALGALTAGVEATITHNVGATDVLIQFYVTATKKAIEFDWRRINNSTAGVTSDIAYGAGAITALVVG